MSIAVISYPVVRGTWNPGFPGPVFHGRRVALAGRRLAQVPAASQPGFPVDAGQQLQDNGAVVQVQIDVPSDYKAAGGKGTPQNLRAMIDTGASISAIFNKNAMAAGLQQTGSTQLGGVGGISESPIFAAALTLPQFNVTVDPIQIAGVSNPLPNVDMLIGRDILKNLVLTYRGLSGAFTLEHDTAAAGGAPGTPPPGTMVPQYGAPPPPSPQPPPPSGQPLPQPPAGTPASTYLLVGGAGAAALAAAGLIFKVF